MLLSSHQIGEVERVADIVAILRQGKLLLVERLDELKSQIRELTVTLKDGAAAPPAVSGEVLRQRHKLRQWQLLVRGLSDEQSQALSANPAVAEVDVRHPNLEEIFVAYMRAGEKPQCEAAIALSEECASAMKPWKCFWRGLPTTPAIRATGGMVGRPCHNVEFSGRGAPHERTLLAAGVERVPHAARFLDRDCDLHRGPATVGRRHDDIDQRTDGRPCRRLFGIGLAMVAFYALGCGAMLFAVEREEETYEFLRTLPVAGRQAMWAKFAVAAASVVALWVCVLVESALVSGLQFPEASQQAYLWGGFGLAAVEALAWGLFFSLLLRRPISAVFAATGAGIVSVSLIVWWVDYEPNLVTGIEDFSEINFYRAPGNPRRRRRRPLACASLVRRIAVRALGCTTEAAGAATFTNSAWPLQQRSEGRGSATDETCSPPSLATMAAVAMDNVSDDGAGVAIVAYLTYLVPVREGVAPFATGAAAFATVVLTALAGANAFQADQSKQSFRFLAERGVRPTTIWFARQLVWLAPIVVWVTATVLVLNAISEEEWGASRSN